MYEKASATAPQAHTTIKSTSVIPTSPSTQKPDTNITTPDTTTPSTTTTTVKPPPEFKWDKYRLPATSHPETYVLVCRPSKAGLGLTTQGSGLL